MSYSGEEFTRTTSEVATKLDKLQKYKIESTSYINKRIVTIRLRVYRGYLTILGE